MKEKENIRPHRILEKKAELGQKLSEEKVEAHAKHCGLSLEQARQDLKRKNFIQK